MAGDGGDATDHVAWSATTLSLSLSLSGVLLFLFAFLRSCVYWIHIAQETRSTSSIAFWIVRVRPRANGKPVNVNVNPSGKYTYVSFATL